MYEMIFKRKSFHLFTNVGNEKISEDEISNIYRVFLGFQPLFPDIKVAIKIVRSKETSCLRGGEYCVLLYSEKKDGYLQNAGYLGEQLDLYLVSQNIGTLWFGIGRPKEKKYKDLDYVIMFNIQKISDQTKYRKDMFKSKRKPLEEIWQGDYIDGVSDIVRFAPSACNSQPWLVKNEGSLLIYRYKKPGKRGIMPANAVSYYNRIDMGIFLLFLDLCLNHNNTAFEKEVFVDDGNANEYNLNAKYTIK